MDEVGRQAVFFGAVLVGTVFAVVLIAEVQAWWNERQRVKMIREAEAWEPDADEENRLG